MTGSSSKDLCSAEGKQAAGNHWPVVPDRHVFGGPGSAETARLASFKEDQLLLEDGQDELQRGRSQPGSLQQQQAISNSIEVADEATSLKLDLDAWQLPPAITQGLKAHGIQKMYPWQAAALQCGADGSNLVYSAPTSGGKSLVADILLMRRLLPARSSKRKSQIRRAIMMLPYISLVSERAADLAKKLNPAKTTVQGYFGLNDSGTPLSARGEDVAVCTIEKANVAINKLIQEKRLGELACVIVDELHMVSDASRGKVLEVCLTKLLAAPEARQIQIIGMSATMAGLEAMCQWLRARLFVTDFRPVPLQEYAVFAGQVHSKVARSKLVEGQCPLVPTRSLAEGQCSPADSLACLVLEAAEDKSPVLVFCASRKSTQTCALALHAKLQAFASTTILSDRKAEREALITEMREAMAGFANLELEQVMQSGIGFHHAGMTSEERRIVEEGYRAGALLILMATSTVAAGVNLPAKRVILRNLRQGPVEVSRAQYLQMVGRAGRAGLCTSGEAFVLGEGEAHSLVGDWQPICSLLTADLPQITSQLIPALERPPVGGGPVAATSGPIPSADTLSGSVEGSCTLLPKQLSQPTLGLAAVGHPKSGASWDCRHLQQLLLEAVAIGLVQTSHDIQRLLEHTLVFTEKPYTMIHSNTMQALFSLSKDQHLLMLEMPAKHWKLTGIGRAVYDSVMPPDLAVQMYQELESKILQGFSLHEPLQAIFVLLGAGKTPVNSIFDWSYWHKKFLGLSASNVAVGKRLGIHEGQILQHLSGRSAAVRNGKAAAGICQDHARFASACMLNELLCEVPAWLVAEEWGAPQKLTAAGVSRGELQKLQAELAQLAAMAALMCASAGWWMAEVPFTQLSQSAAAGVRPDLIELSQVPGIRPDEARILHDAHLRSPGQLAAADEEHVAEQLAKGLQRTMQDRRQASAMIAPRGFSVGKAMAKRHAKRIVSAARIYHLEHGRAAAGSAEDTTDMTQAESSTQNARARMKGSVRAHEPAEPCTGMAQVAILGPDIDVAILGEVKAMFSQQTVALQMLGTTHQQQDKPGLSAQGQLPHVGESSSTLQGAALCCQALQIVILIWQKEGHRSQVTLDLFQAIIADAAILAGHELSSQQGLANLQQHSWKTARDTAVASSLLSGLQAHQHCGIDQLQAQWAHQLSVRLPVLPEGIARACQTALVVHSAHLPLFRDLSSHPHLLQVYEQCALPSAAIAASTSQNGVKLILEEVKALLGLEEQARQQCLGALANLLGQIPRLDHPAAIRVLLQQRTGLAVPFADHRADLRTWLVPLQLQTYQGSPQHFQLVSSIAALMRHDVTIKALEHLETNATELFQHCTCPGTKANAGSEPGSSNLAAAIVPEALTTSREWLSKASVQEQLTSGSLPAEVGVDGLPVAVLVSELQHVRLPLPLASHTLPGQHKIAGLLLTIDDDEPRTMLDFDENRPGQGAGWRGSGTHHKSQAAVRLPMALHSNGWLETQVVAVDCCAIHAFTPQGLRATACSWLGHPALSIQHAASWRPAQPALAHPAHGPEVDPKEATGAFKWAADIDADMLDASFAELVLPDTAAAGPRDTGHCLLWLPHSLRGLLHPQPCPSDTTPVLVSLMPLHLEVTALAHMSQEPSLLRALQSRDPLLAAADFCSQIEDQAHQSSAARPRLTQDQAICGLQALIHGWPMSVLASRLRCATGGAAAIFKNLLATLPQLASWRARIEALDSPSCALATLSGRHISLNCKGANKTRQAISILCHEAAEDIAMHFTAAMGNLTAQACAGVNGKLPNLKAGLGQLLAGLLRLQRTTRPGSVSSCGNSLNELASAGLLALARPQFCQQRLHVDQTQAQDAKPTTPASNKAAPSSKGKPATVLESKREYRRQQQQQKKQGQGQGQLPPAGRPQPWPQADGANRGLRLPQLPDAAPAAPSAPPEPVIETRRRIVATEATVHQLQREQHTNLYFPVPASTLSEAFRSRTEGPAAYLPPTGCAGLQGEYEHTGKEYVMLRSCIDALIQIAAKAGPLPIAPGAAMSSADPQAGPPETDSAAASDGADPGAASLQSGMEVPAETSVSKSQATSAVADKARAAESAAPAASDAKDGQLRSGSAVPAGGAQSPAVSDSQELEPQLEAGLDGVSRPAPSKPFLPDKHMAAIADLRKLYLVGPSGSGKSVALAILAHWARTSGWLVLYIPTAKALIEGGTFRQHESGGWDNPENARLLLSSLLHHHKAHLDSMPAAATAEAGPDGGEQAAGEGASNSAASLGDIARAAMDPLQDSLPVQAVLDIVDHLLHQNQIPVLLAIDDYPALTLPKTDYGTGTSEIKRRQLSTSELRLAAGLRLMTRDAPNLGLTVCAAHPSSTISPLQPVPLKHAALLSLQRYNRAEVEAAMAWYTAQGKVEDLPDNDDIAWAHQITAGNATELRKLSDLLLLHRGLEDGQLASTA
ncbi:hypothetical protein WJX74_007629 [Apatococcus lobatus]|uniref:DNA-directed DNA polymerase n=1 Tax=Apatococcus lobatus TaxID=904363 RepID=A0AAW1RPT9_9CHLO